MSIAEPAKIITPWADTGSKNPIPQNSNNTTGAAGYDKGFPDITMTPPEAGGIPPAGQDFNGIFYEVTKILRYIQAGGRPTFSATLAAEIGGYPKGALVLGSDGIAIYTNRLESNSSNPNSGGSGWAREDLMLREALRRSYAEAGYTLVAGSFEAGGTVTTTTDVLLHEASGKAYYYTGVLPHTAVAGSVPSSEPNWISAENNTLNNVLFEKIIQLAIGIDTSGHDKGWYQGSLLKLNFQGVVTSITPDVAGVYHFNGSTYEDALLYEKYLQRQNGLIIGWGDTVEDEAALRRALAYAEPRGIGLKATIGELLATALPQITLTSTLELPATVTLDMRGGVLVFPENITRAIKARISPSGVAENYSVILENAIVVAGDIHRNDITGILAGEGIYQEVHGVTFRNVDVRGFIDGLVMGENTWVNRFEDCTFWFNHNAMKFDQTGLINAGAGFVFDRCLFAWNGFVFRNYLCELTFNDCAFDQMYYRVTDQCVNSQSGTFNSETVFNDCRFEADKAGARPWFKTDGGCLVFNNPKFLGPVNAQYLFDGTGDAYINGGLTRLPDAKVLAEQYVNIRVKTPRPANIGSVLRWKEPSVHWYNSNLTNGTAGYTAPSGSISVGSGGAVISGNRLLYKYAGPGPDCVLLFPKINVINSTILTINFYSKGGSADIVYYLDCYSGDTVVLQLEALYSAISPTFVSRNINLNIPGGVDSVRLRTQVNSSFTTDCEMCDFEITHY